MYRSVHHSVFCVHTKDIALNAISEQDFTNYHLDKAYTYTLYTYTHVTVFSLGVTFWCLLLNT